MTTLRLARPWRVLTGDVSPAFDLEPALSLFLVKTFIHGRRSANHTNLHAAPLFGALHFTQWNGADSSSPATRIKSYLKDKQNRLLFSACFRRSSIYDLAKHYSLEALFKSYRKWDWEKEYHAKLTCMRLLMVEKFKVQRLALAKEKLDELKLPGLKSAYTNRAATDLESRAAYLFAADHSIKSMLKYSYTPDNLFTKMQEEHPSAQESRQFCAYARFASMSLKIPGQVEMKRWTSVEPVRPPADEIMMEAVLSLAPPMKNTAAETKREKESRKPHKPQKAVGI